MKVDVRYASLYRDAESDLRRLQDIFPALELQEHFQLSAEPPAWLQFVSDAMTWKLVFGTAATAYITALAKHLADATWESRKSVRPLVVAACGALIKSFRDFYTALVAIRQRNSRPVSVDLQIPWPGRDDGVGIQLRLEDEAEFYELLALFVGRSELIATAVEELHRAGVRPLGYPRYLPTARGFALAWMDRDDLRYYEQEFDEDGHTKTPRQQKPFPQT